ncbi:MAG: flagellar hook-basal body complex protein [Pseudomonadota bacterium]
MDDSLYYLSLNRQRGLKAEMSAIANNIANIDTPGFRREGMVFSEFVVSSPEGESLSMADMNTRFISPDPASMRMTAAPLDLAIEGEGYFAIEDEQGFLLTRAGAFQRSEEGLLVTSRGESVLDSGQAPIFLPVEAGPIQISRDGTVSAGGVEQAQIGVFNAPPETMTRFANTGFRANDGIDPVANPRVLQGALEGSNVDAVLEIARMIEVSRAYERVQGLIQDEDDRIQNVIQTLGQPV